MQNAGLQYGEGATPVQEPPFVTNPVQINSSNSTSSLRQFRKKDNVDKAAGVSGGLSAANSGGTDSTNSSHVARVAPHNHYPHKQNEYFRYPPQYQEYSSPPVKYSEIAEPVIQPIPHLDHLPPSVLSKHKEKEYVEMCNIPQQSHLNKAYPEHQFNGQQSYPPEMSMHHQYMHKETQGSQIHSPYKPESQYIPKETAFNHQIPPYLKYNIPQSRNYVPLDNSSLTPFQRMDPHLARSFMADHHHIREFPAEYSPIEQSRMYAQKQRYYPTPLPPTNATYPPNYPHRNIPAQQYNYPSCNYPRSSQMNSSMGRYSMNMERSISPRRTYSENMEMTMNFAPVPQKIPANYPNYPAYAQHYQQRRPPAVPQEYYHPQQHPHSRAHAQYMQSHHPQEIPENHVASNNIRQYLENWAEEEPATELPTTIENSKYMPRLNRDEPNEVYVINASELPQYLENGVPLIASENGQYIFKSNVSIDNTGAIKIIDKTVENVVLPTDAQERVVSLHIIENPKADCLVNNRPSNVNQEHQVATNQAPQGGLNVITTNTSHPNMENTAQRSYTQPGYNPNRMNVHQVSPMTQNSETSINLSMQPNASHSPQQQVNRSSSRSPQKIHGTTSDDQLKIQVLSYNEVPQNSCIVMPSTQNRLNFDESLLPNPVPCDPKQKKNDFEVKTNQHNEANSVISNVMSEEAILKEAHEELDKIVQDTLTSTNIHLHLENCDRNQIPKMEEKCAEENLNSRIPDYLNLDLESNAKDLTGGLSECPMSNVEESMENEAIMDLSITSRRTSKSGNENQEITNSAASLSNRPTKDKHGQNTEKKDDEGNGNKDSIGAEEPFDMDKTSTKHMPLIFDGFEEHSTQKSEAKSETIDTNILNESQEPFVEEKKQTETEEREDNESKKVGDESLVPESSELVLQSCIATATETLKGVASKSKEDELSSEKQGKIEYEKSSIANKVETSEKFEEKDDTSNDNSVKDCMKVETKDEEPDSGGNNEQSVENKKENKTEKEIESLERKNTFDVARSGIKRKRIFSVDDIIYRIGLTASQIQNAFSDTTDCKVENEITTDESIVDHTNVELLSEEKSCSSKDKAVNSSSQMMNENPSSKGEIEHPSKHPKREETDNTGAELLKENPNPKELVEDLRKHPKKGETDIAASQLIKEDPKAKDLIEDSSKHPKNEETDVASSQLVKENPNPKELTEGLNKDPEEEQPDIASSQLVKENPNQKELTEGLNKDPEEEQPDIASSQLVKENPNQKEPTEVLNKDPEEEQPDIASSQLVKENPNQKEPTEVLNKDPEEEQPDIASSQLVKENPNQKEATEGLNKDPEEEQTDIASYQLTPNSQELSEDLTKHPKEEEKEDSEINDVNFLESNEDLDIQPQQDEQKDENVRLQDNDEKPIAEENAVPSPRTTVENSKEESICIEDAVTVPSISPNVKVIENVFPVIEEMNPNSNHDVKLELEDSKCELKSVDAAQNYKEEIDQDEVQPSVENVHDAAQNCKEEIDQHVIKPSVEEVHDAAQNYEAEIDTDEIKASVEDVHDAEQNYKEEIDKDETKPIVDEVHVDDTSTTKLGSEENSSEQTEQDIAKIDELFEEKPDEYHETEMQELSAVHVTVVSEETVTVVEEDIETTLENEKIKILSDEIVVQENEETVFENPSHLEESVTNDRIKTESLKRNLSETEITNEDATENTNKKLKLNDSESTEMAYIEETIPEIKENSLKKIDFYPQSINSCRFSVIQRTETIQREIANMAPSEKNFQELVLPIHEAPCSQVKVEEIKEEEPTSHGYKSEDEAVTKDESDDVALEEIEDTSPSIIEVEVPKKVEDTITNQQDPYKLEEHTSVSSEVVISEVEETPTISKISIEPPQNAIKDELLLQEVNTDLVPPPEVHNSRKKAREEITFEQRFVEPLLKNNSAETSQKNDHQEEKSPAEDCQYRSVLKIEENMVLLEICGELVEISVNQINGRKVITVVPISSSATVDINDNYEHTDRSNIGEQMCHSHSPETVQIDSEMPELREETSVDLEEESQEKKLPVLVKMISSSEDIDNVIRTEEITSTQTEAVESNEEIFEDIILNENEIIIGDESLEEEINLDLRSDEDFCPEKPVLCTKAAKKLYEDVSVKQPTKPHSSLREFRKIKTKPEQSIERKNSDDQSTPLKEKKHPKGTTRTSTRQKVVSEQKEESQVALQELIKQRKMRKEKIRLKYPYIIKNTEVACENPQAGDTGVVKVRQDKEVRSEIRKVSKISSDIVKMEKNQISSVVHKVKSNEMNKKESSEIHGTKAKCKEKVRRRSVDESKEKVHIVASVIVKEPFSNIDTDKLKIEEKPTSTSHICSNTTTASKDISAQNFQEARTSTGKEVAKNSNVQEKHSKFPKISTPRDLSLTKNINEHYLSRKDHSNLKKKLSIQEYNSRKRKMEESRIVPIPEKIMKMEEPSKVHSLEKDHDRPSTIYSGRLFENVSNCVKDPRRLQFMNSEHPTLSRRKSEESTSCRAPNISTRSFSSGAISSPPAITINTLLNTVSTNNQMKHNNASIPKKLFAETCEPKQINRSGRKSTETNERKYEPLETHKRKVSFDDNVQINEINTTQTKVCKSRQNSVSNYCEVTSSCCDIFEERSQKDNKIENTRLEYQNNLVRRLQMADKIENNWEDSNSPKDCITDAFSDCFLEKTRPETVKNITKTKLIIDINDFDTSLINNELKGSYKNNTNSGEESLKNYKEEVDIKLNSLNIQIPKTTKNRVLNEDDLLMHKFLRKEQLNSDEIKQIRRIIYFKKKIQQLTQQNVTNNNKIAENKYEIKKSPESSANKELKLQLKKVDGKIKKKKKRFRNLYSNSPETSETEIQESAGEFSVYEGENISGVKLIFKRKTDFLNLQPVVRLQRCRYIDSMAKKMKFQSIQGPNQN